ncbi:hypothetical protein K0U83_22565 [bacterium]|nr:hypothetical protein [bacterium]
MNAAVEFQDLLPLKYAAGSYDPGGGSLDCYGATAEIVGRALGAAARVRFLEQIKKPTHNWIPVQGSIKLGDVVVSRAGSGLHVSGVAATSPPLVVSAASEYGVYAQRLSTVRDIEGLYRDPGSPCP